MSTQKAPLVIPPLSQSSNPATVIFLHGFKDQGTDFEIIARNIQSAKRLPHINWIFPNAPQHEKLGVHAWYDLCGIRPGVPGQTRDPQDKAGLLHSMEYVVKLVDEQINQGVPVHRIVVSGFSQGCALSLLTGLVSKYSGQYAGIAGFAGYMPLADQIPALQAEKKCPEIKDMPILLMRGERDHVMMPEFATLTRLEALGYGHLIESKVHDVGHEISDAVIDDFADWLEKVLPDSKGSS